MDVSNKWNDLWYFQKRTALFARSCRDDEKSCQGPGYVFAWKKVIYTKTDVSESCILLDGVVQIDWLISGKNMNLQDKMKFWILIFFNYRSDVFFIASASLIVSYIFTYLSLWNFWIKFKMYSIYLMKKKANLPSSYAASFCPH